MTKVCLVGVGRTGAEIARVILSTKNLDLVAAFCSPKSEKENKDIGDVIGVKPIQRYVYSCEVFQEVLEELQPDVVVDFSNPKATLEYAKMIGELGINHIIGTTGFTKTQIKRLMVYARKNGNGILYAPNVTLGVNVMMLLSNIAASILNDYDFQITEIHHRYKKDAPSGTAFKIAASVNKGLNYKGDKEEAFIPINAVRAGGVIGRHELMVVGDNDKVEIVHESFSRKAFADGVLRGIYYINGKSGYYEMSDVLDIDSILEAYIDDKKKRRSKKSIPSIKRNYHKLNAVNYI